MASSAAKQKLLARTLYRSLHRWCQGAPANASLVHLDQWVEGELIDSPKTLQATLRRTFRQSPQSGITKEDIQKMLDGLRLLNSLNPDDLSINDHSQTSSPKPTHWVDSVEWLPPMSEMANDTVNDTHFPVFPLSGPLLPSEESHLPLFSQFSDIPVPGMEIPLKIFEPRYRQLYQDVLSNGRKQFVVPFCHPHQSATFASWGWLYEIVRVQDVADQTNGEVQMLCHHLVTKPVRISSIVNPSDWNTKFTYLRAQAEVIQTDFVDPQHLTEIESLLRRAQSSSHEDAELVGRLLSALGEGNLWSLVHVWVSNLQMEVLQLQVKIAATIQTNASFHDAVGIELISEAQQPHREKLESHLMELSTLVPLLLQDSSPRQQCQRMYERIRERLGDNC